MTETTEPSTAKKRGGLNGMLLADLKSLAGTLGVSGAGGMKKAQLVDAIKVAQSGGGSQTAEAPPPPTVTTRTRGQRGRQGTPSGSPDGAPDGATAASPRPDGASDSQEVPAASQDEARARNQDRTQDRTQDRAPDKAPDKAPDQAPDKASDKPDRPLDRQGRSQDRPAKPQQDQPGGRQGKQDQPSGQPQGKQGRQDQPQGRQDQPQGRQDQPQGKQDRQPEQPAGEDPSADGQADGEGDGRRNRRRRGRDRDRTRPAAGVTPGQRGEPDTTILDDDVLVPAAGILDVLDNYAFVRTSGYLPGPDDVYVSLSLVRRLGLRRGDAVTGEVRQPRDGERREKFNPMVRIDTVNGSDPEEIKDRFDFAKLTPVHPTERLRLETGPDQLAGRVIDLLAPIGKGQRGLVVAPAETGRTTLLQAVASSVTSNNPECHLMVVLVDERPEEVTDFERSVKGEVIASTFDRPATDHTVVAELAIERAKRLVELGHDVVVLLDGLTRLGRAYNAAAPAGGRVLSGGVDATALFAPKRFFGAARNIENGGSLTILATVLAGSGSPTDEAILEELRDTANWELRLDRELAGAGLHPAVDAGRSGTRHEDQLLTAEEREVVGKLRRGLAGLEGRAAAELLIQRLRRTHTNIELLMQVQRTPTWPGRE